MRRLFLLVFLGTWSGPSFAVETKKCPAEFSFQLTVDRFKTQEEIDSQISGADEVDSESIRFFQQGKARLFKRVMVLDEIRNSNCYYRSKHLSKSSSVRAYIAGTNRKRFLGIDYKLLQPESGQQIASFNLFASDSTPRVETYSFTGAFTKVQVWGEAESFGETWFHNITVGDGVLEMVVR